MERTTTSLRDCFPATGTTLYTNNGQEEEAECAARPGRRRDTTPDQWQGTNVASQEAGGRAVNVGIDHLSQQVGQGDCP